MKLDKVQPRKVGDSVEVYDDFNGKPNYQYNGTVTNITKCYITVKHPLGHSRRFHKKNGQVVGYSFPGDCAIIALETV